MVLESPLAGKAAVVTGASRGVGRATAIRLAELGADVALTARTVAPRDDDLGGTIHDTASVIESHGRRAVPIAADLTDAAAVTSFAEEVLETLGRVDILVNNAADTGDNVFRGFWDTNAESWAQQIQVNLNAMYATMRAFAPSMKANGGGLIVNLGSMREVDEGLNDDADGSREYPPLGAAYPTSKIAVYAMSTFLGQELAADDIVVVTMSPGPAATETFLHHAKEMGWDPSFATPVEFPVETIAYLATCEEPKRYAARFIDAVEFAGKAPEASPPGS